jgi:hypothetical protein
VSSGHDAWLHVPSLVVAFSDGSSVWVFPISDRLLCGVFNLIIAVWLSLFVAYVCVGLSF